MESKFIIECKNIGKDQSFYLKKIGPKQWNIEWTDDPYKAKVLDTKQRAEKEAERIHTYIKYCYEHGYDSHSVWNEETHSADILKDVNTFVREIKLVFV